MKIDAHQHFWKLNLGYYSWLTPDLQAIYRDFSPEELKTELDTAGIDGTVLVQAAATVAETRYMLSLAEEHDFIKGVVGWIDFESANAITTLQQLATSPKLVGIRPMIQDISDDDWMLNESFCGVFDAMIQHNLVFDALTFPRHLKILKRLLERHPHLSVVIDHASKPNIEAGEFEPWATEMADIATLATTHVKLSGLVTEAGSDWTVQQLQPYVSHLIKHFGPHRLLWGSDWPVCLLASEYQRWREASDELLSELDDGMRKSVFGENAARVYRLDRTGS